MSNDESRRSRSKDWHDDDNDMRLISKSRKRKFAHYNFSNLFFCFRLQASPSSSCSLTCLLAYLLACLLAYLLACLLACLLTCLLAYLLACLLACLHACLLWSLLKAKFWITNLKFSTFSTFSTWSRQVLRYCCWIVDMFCNIPGTTLVDLHPDQHHTCLHIKTF